MNNQGSDGTVGGPGGASMSHPNHQKCIRFIIRGRVQGVWFRESTRREAGILGLKGHAINLQDGSVEVVASGGAAELEKLATWLRHGPPLARVERVSAEDIPNPGSDSFTTR